MFRRISGRIALFYTLLIAALFGTVSIIFAQTSCLADSGCVSRVLGLAAVVGVLAAIGIAWTVADRTTRPLRAVGEAADRIAAGGTTSRILPYRRDEVGDLIIAFNRMVDSQRDQIDRLSEEHQQFGIVLDQMADGVLITDGLSHVTLINPAACRMLRTEEDEAIGRSFAAVVRQHQLIELWQRCQVQGAEQIEAVEIGMDMFLQAVVTPFEQKGASGYLIILQDLTQVRRLQTMRRDFISNLSHELRSPLASLRAVVETLQDGALDDPPAAVRFLDRAEREVDTMTQMVEELTELSQIESGQIRLRLAPVTIQEIVDVPLERSREQAERAGLELLLELPDGLPPVLVDSERIQQVVTNLLHNAIKFTPPGGTVILAASIDEAGNAAPYELTVAISDTGSGIAKQDLSRIFERFYKSDRARTRGRGGTGLGLAIARHIIQSHGGRLWVRSKEGKGSTFYFTLPLAAAAMPISPVESTTTR